jgi:hypothetical protein
MRKQARAFGPELLQTSARLRVLSARDGKSLNPVANVVCTF